MGEYWQQKRTQHAPSTKSDYDYLNGWIRKRSHIEAFLPEWCISTVDRGFPTRMVYLYYILCLLCTILVGNPCYHAWDTPFWSGTLDMQKPHPKWWTPENAEEEDSPLLWVECEILIRVKFFFFFLGIISQQSWIMFQETADSNVNTETCTARIFVIESKHILPCWVWLCVV